MHDQRGSALMPKKGRPTKLTPAILKKAQEYVDGGFTSDGVVPSVAGLAVHLGFRRNRLYEWATKNQDFQDTLDAIQDKQQALLLNSGLSGDFNSTITKLMLANHGFHDKVDNQNVEIPHESWLESLDD